MRNPLNAIISHCTLLEKEMVNTTQQNRLKTIKISCNLLTSFLHDLVDWTQIKMNKFKKKNIKFDIKQCFNDVIDMLRFKVEFKEIYCKIKFDDNMP